MNEGGVADYIERRNLGKVCMSVHFVLPMCFAICFSTTNFWGDFLHTVYFGIRFYP